VVQLAFRVSGDKNFKGLWGMITWNHALQAQYPNLLILAELAHVQCVSIVTCEHVFSVHNRLGSGNLKAMIRSALEGPDEGVYDIISDSVPLGRMTTNTLFVC
jgi:hypothetical protein